jgi:tRNA (guanine37-N1)-methyltransferase
MLRVNVVTLFAELFREPFATSILGRAAAAELVRYNVVNLRDFTHDRHHTVDDTPYGGGAGMVMKPEPFFEALEELNAGPPTVLLSARGKPFRHDDAVRYGLGEELTLLCGHYKDVDERITTWPGLEEVSVSDAVLSGGEFAALCVVDAVVRLLPGALGDHDSAAGDSMYDGLLSAPSYTRPAEYRGMKVPEVLMSGDHARVAEWRRARAEEITKKRRPDLWARYEAEHRSDEAG